MSNSSGGAHLTATAPPPPTMQVPFFPYPYVFEQYAEEIERELMRCIRSGAYILQGENRAFEEGLARLCGVRRAIGVGNATDALELILAALGIGEGDEVIMPAHTFVASASPVIHAGAKPVLAEVGSDHLIDPADVEARITKRTRAIMPTQLNGRTADMDAIGEIAERHGLLVLEDSAQGLGSRFRGRMAGTFAPAGIYSFYPAKTLGCLGDGGAIITDDDQLADRLLGMRDHGRAGHGGAVRSWGRNSRLDNIQAAVLLVKLPHMEEEFEARRAVARRYHDQLSDLEALHLPPAPDADPRHHDVYQNYEVEAERRDELRQFLANAGVGTILQWGGKALHQFPELGFEVSLPVTERVMARSFLLPMNSSLTPDQIDYVCEQIRSFYGGSIS